MFFLSLFGLYRYNLCIQYTLALVFKETTKKEKEKKRRSLLGCRLKQGEQVFCFYFVVVVGMGGEEEEGKKELIF